MERKNMNNSVQNEETKQGYPPYDDDKFYDIEAVSSANDCTGLIPTPPKSEYEAESYSDLMNIPCSKGEVDNGFQRIRPGEVNKK